MTNVGEVFLVRYHPDVAETTRRNPAGLAYCDKSGTLHVPDYAVMGPLGLAQVKRDGDVIIARYSDDKQFVVWGVPMRPEGEAARIRQDMIDKGMGAEAAANIARAYQKSCGQPLFSPEPSRGQDVRFSAGVSPRP